MSIRSTTSSELSKVQAPKVQSSSSGWKAIPHINQLQPRGADAAYVNGAYNCAPAIVAMLARGVGKKGQLSDAQLISELSQGLVTREGTTPRGVATMLGRVGLPVAGKALAGNYSDAAVKEHLDKGHKLIAQVALTDANGKNASGHYILIRGINAKGNYVISDPMASKSTVVTPEQLRDAIKRAPPDGGLLLPVAASGSSSPFKLPVPKISADVFARSQAGQKAESAPATPTSSTAPAAPGSQPAASSSPLSGISRTALTSIQQIFASQADPDASAFAFEDSVFEGVNTQFSEVAGAGTPTRLSPSELRNVATLSIDYGDKGAKRSMLKSLIQVSPKDKTVDEVVQQLRQLKQNNDPKVDKILERLEGSLALKDVMVLAKFRQAELRDPGVGKKTWVEPM